MKATINRLELLPLAKAAESIVPNTTSIEELKCLRLEMGSNGMGTIRATNLEVALEQRFPADIQEQGTMIINARMFTDMLTLLGGDTVTLSGEDGKRLEVVSGDAYYSIPLLSSGNYPRMEIPFPEDTVVVSGIPSIAKRTVFAVAEDENRPLMRCVNLIFSSNGLRAVSCDGFRLVSAKGESKSAASISMMVPASSLEKLGRLLENKDELYVGTTGQNIVFTKENFVFSARLMNGKRIDADTMLGSVKSSFTILTDTAALKSAVASVTSVAGDGTIFSLRFQGGRLWVSCESESGTSTQEISVVPLSGDPSGEYWYQHQQLSECLRVLGGTLMLEVGQNGVLLMRTDDLVCLQTAKRKPTVLKRAEASGPAKAA